MACSCSSFSAISLCTTWGRVVAMESHFWAMS
uniref:Uncharacterized protein n=1 Tax=Anguilla anguilla TaxID=7936 RepID=A0A0E9SSZ2_ANGAN